MLFDEDLRISSALPAGTVRFGTSRTRALLDALGSPDCGLRIVHVAGTNGKGSVCAMLSSVLVAAGYRTGVFTSPAVLFRNETVTVNGVPLADEDYARLSARVDAAASVLDDAPTPFERETALAFLAFEENGCRFAVTECGLGGRDDATNAVRGKALSVITSVGLDHTRELGGTVADVARAKAGIITGRAVCAPQNAEAAAVLYPLCTVAGAPESVVLTDEGTRFVYDGKEWTTSLCGAHQAVNAALVAEAVKALREQGVDIPDDALAKGLSDVVHHARFEVLNESNIAKSPYNISIPHGKTLVLDGAHNPHGAKALAETLCAVFGAQRIAAVFGVLADKDVEGIATTLAPRFFKVLTVTPPSPRGLAADEARDVFRRAAERGGQATVTGIAPDVRQGVAALFGETDVVAVCGSLTLFRALTGEDGEGIQKR